MSLSEALSKSGRPAAARSAQGTTLSLALTVLVATLGATAISGCGGSPLQPLYGTTASGRSMPEAMANVDVALIPGRVGQRVRNELLFYTRGGSYETGEDAPALQGGEYRLEIALRESTQAVLVSTTGLAGGQVLALDATFKIVRIKDGKAVFQSNAYARAPFEMNKVTDPLEARGTSTGRSVFANVRASYDAQNRAANAIASDIRTRVAAYLSGAQ